MKTLILIRHAKSSWNEPGASDFERSLNHRGLHDAPMMGERLAMRLKLAGINLDAFACSTARRAAQTAEHLATSLQFPFASIDWRKELYLASPVTILQVIQAMPAGATSVALLAHNPGITELAEILTGRFLGNVPTCGMITLELPIESWMEAGGRAKLVDFDYPKLRYDQNAQE